jgi:hypothetical protein
MAKMRPLPVKKSITLAEMLLATAITAFAICNILVMYTACFDLIGTAKNMNIATNAAQGLIEGMRNSTFQQIDDTYGVNPTADADISYSNFVVNAIPSSMGVVYINDTNPELLQATVSVCWRQKNRVIGEDKNLNGALDAGEDANGNKILDSPVELTTLIVNR